MQVILGSGGARGRGLVEMMYQNDRDYVFDSSKFDEHFDFEPTPYERGIREMIAADFGR
jgi:hypothetical protein